MKAKDVVSLIALIFVVAGALNWLLFGIFQFNLVGWLFGGSYSIFSRILYVLVGISGLWLIIDSIIMTVERNRHRVTSA